MSQRIARKTHGHVHKRRCAASRKHSRVVRRTIPGTLWPRLVPAFLHAGDMSLVKLSLPRLWTDAPQAGLDFSRSFHATTGRCPAALLFGSAAKVEGAVLPPDPGAENPDLPALAAYVGIFGAQRALLMPGEAAGLGGGLMLELRVSSGGGPHVMLHGEATVQDAFDRVNLLLKHYALQPLPAAHRPLVLDDMARRGFRLLLP